MCLLASMLGGVAHAQELPPLFNGRDLTGWVEMGEPGGFVVEDGMLVLKAPRNHPNWLRTTREFENFDLKRIYGQVAAGEIRCRDGDWCQLRLMSDGAYTGVWINGRQVAESNRLQLPDEGRIGLQMHSAGRIEYLTPRVRPLR